MTIWLEVKIEELSGSKAPDVGELVNISVPSIPTNSCRPSWLCLYRLWCHAPSRSIPLEGCSQPVGYRNPILVDHLVRVVQTVVPRTFTEYTSRRVLTTSWLEGEKLSGSKADDVGELVDLGVPSISTNLCKPCFVFVLQIVVPRTFTEYTSRRVLTTSWLEGEKLSGSKADDVGELVNLGVICYLKQLLETGFFHVSTMWFLHTLAPTYGVRCLDIA